MDSAMRRMRRLAAGAVEGLDSTLLVVTMLLAAVGLVALYSASHDVPSRVSGQLGNLAVAFAAMWLISRVPSELLMRAALPIYLVGFLLLVGVNATRFEIPAAPITAAVKASAAAITIAARNAAIEASRSSSPS